MDRDPLDPAGLVREAYAMPGLTPSECRSIFLDWALKHDGDTTEAIEVLLARYGDPAHPMTAVLRAALDRPDRAGRRGGAAGRRRS